MSNRDQLTETSRFLHENDHFLVVNHLNPDGDATGSILAMGYILQALKKNFTLINEGVTPAKFLDAAPSEFVILNLSELPLQDKYRNIITLDCGDLARVGNVVQCFQEEAQILNIDHHATNDHFGTVNLVRSNACATTEILYDLAFFESIALKKTLARFLYMGILTDTGGFRYDNTTSEVMEKAASLLQSGIEPADIADKCLETISRSYLDLLQRVLPTLTTYKEDQISFLSISQEAREKSGVKNDDMDQVVDYAKNIEGVEVGVLLKQIDQQTVKVSLRSRKNVDVSAVAQSLGGGGHERAAGCTIYNESLERAKGLVLKEIKRFWG